MHSRTRVGDNAGVWRDPVVAECAADEGEYAVRSATHAQPQPTVRTPASATSGLGGLYQ